MENTPSNNPHDPGYCDSCYREIADNECDCCNDGGWGWYPFHDGGEG
jgi:hypothetical protein